MQSPRKRRTTTTCKQQRELNSPRNYLYIYIIFSLFLSLFLEYIHARRVLLCRLYVRACECVTYSGIIVNRAQFNLTNMGPTHHPAQVHCAVKYRVLFLFCSFLFIYFFKLHYIIYLRNIMCVCVYIMYY